MGSCRAFAFGLVCICARAQTGPGWSLARTAHFEVYAQAEAETARSTILWLEQLRALFVEQTGLKLEQAAPGAGDRLPFRQ